MVNHIRTLLLNTGYCTSQDYTMYVPPEFTATLRIPSSCKAVANIIDDTVAGLIGTENTEDTQDNRYNARVRAVDAICRLLHSPELNKYMLAFDNRITYPTDVNVNSLYRMEDDAPVLSAILQRFNSAVNNGDISGELFDVHGVASTGTESFGTIPVYLKELGNAYHDLPGLLKLGCALLGYAYQLEYVRSKWNV